MSAFLAHATALTKISPQQEPTNVPSHDQTLAWLKWRSRYVSVVWLESHDDDIKWKHFPRYWPFVRGIHRSPVKSPHKGLWRRALIFSLICVWINGWVNNREAGDLRRYRAHYDVIVMLLTEQVAVFVIHLSPCAPALRHWNSGTSLVRNINFSFW